MAFDAELALQGQSGGQAGVFKDGVKQDQNAMAQNSGFIGTNNMGMKLGPKAPPVAGSSLGGFANVGNPMAAQKPALPQLPSLNQPIARDQNELNAMQIQQYAKNANQGSMFGQGGMFQDSTGSMRIM